LESLPPGRKEKKLVVCNYLKEVPGVNTVEDIRWLLQGFDIVSERKRWSDKF